MHSREPHLRTGSWASSCRSARNLLLVCVLAVLLSGSLVALDVNRSVTQFSQKVWTTEHGLPENFVRTVVQTRDGYLWLGTQEGLVRFDGLQLRVFDTRNTLELASNSIVTLAEDAEGVLWIGTDGGGVARYREGKFLPSLSTREGLPNDYIREIYAAADGAVWITAHEGGLIRLHGADRRIFTTADGLRDNSLRTVMLDHSGRLWIGYNEEGLGLLEKGVYRYFTSADGLAGGQIRAIYEDRRGRIWVGTRGAGLFCWENHRFHQYTRKDGLPANSIRVLREDSDGALWIGLESGGLVRLYHGRFEVLGTNQGLPHNFVRAILEDNEGNLWLGTRGGLMRLRDRAVETWTTTSGLINDNVKAVFAEHSGAIWIGTATGLNLMRKGRIQTVPLSGDWSRDFVRAIAQSRDGTMWFGTDLGLFRRDTDGLRHYQIADGLPDNRVRSLLEDKAGRLWVGTAKGVAVLSPEDGQVERPLGAVPGDEFPPAAYIQTLALHPDGAIWIGAGDGLFRYSNNRIARFSSDDGLPHNTITALHVDGRGELWVATRGGLSLLRGKRFVSVTRRHGLRSDNILQVLTDAAGALWLSSAHGVSRIPIDDLERFFDGQVSSIQPITFDTADGMRSSEFSGEGHPSATQAPDGKLWFATIHGLAVLDPYHLRISGKPPRVVIEEVRSGERAFPGTSPAIAIPAGDGDLEIQFTAISFAAPERIRFRYFLEGFDQEWVEAGRRRTAFYTNLPPGEYRFRVAANPYNGSWPQEEVSQALALQPHFYQRPWFYALCLAALVAFAVFLHRLHIRNIQGRFEAVLNERTRIAREIHDTLMQGVTGISLQLEASSQQVLTSPAQAKERMDLALEKLDATLAEARECVLDLRSPEAAPAVPPRSLVAALRDMAEQAIGGLPIALQFQVEGPERDLPPFHQAQLLRIAREAITNAAAHAAAARLQISLAFEPGSVSFALRDDGRGFDPSQVNEGHFGIVGMRERARDMSAQFELRSSPGQGTEVLIRLPTIAGA